MKRFPVVSGKIKSDQDKNLEVRNLDVKFPKPDHKRKPHQAQGLKAGVKQSTNYRRVVHMMTQRVSTKTSLLSKEDKQG